MCYQHLSRSAEMRHLVRSTVPEHLCKYSFDLSALSIDSTVWISRYFCDCELPDLCRAGVQRDRTGVIKLHPKTQAYTRLYNFSAYPTHRLTSCPPLLFGRGGCGYIRTLHSATVDRLQLATSRMTNICTAAIVDLNLFEVENQLSKAEDIKFSTGPTDEQAVT
jgi:hypothetical protein